MYTPIEQQKLLDVLQSTLKTWETNEYNTNFNYTSPCALCIYIRSCVKLNFKKADLTGTCGYCPIYFFGGHFICDGISKLPMKNNLIAERAFNLLKNSAVSMLNNLITAIETPELFSSYNKFVLDSKQKISMSPIKPNSYRPVVKKQRIYSLKIKE